MTWGEPAARHISIHAPRRGSDKGHLSYKIGADGFQSTLPAGGATSRSWRHGASAMYFNPRSPQGERQAVSFTNYSKSVFQSTLPAGGATGSAPRAGGLAGISIHAPRRGSDLPQSARENIVKYFNPRSPQGERLRGSLPFCFRLDISIHAPRRGSDLRSRPHPCG